MTRCQILISAGEASGDLYAARLATALRARADVELFGLGGPEMHAAGVEIVAPSSEVAVVGITEVFRRLPSLRRTMRRLLQEAAQRRPALAILTDFPGFHLRLARRLRWLGFRNVYFICPQFWAWRPWRVRLVKRRFARALCIFPFEEKFYRDAGVPVEFIGHPLVDIVKTKLSRKDWAEQMNLDPRRPILALLPGSRPSELAYHLPTMLEACHRLSQTADCQFVIAAAPGLEGSQIPALLRRDLPVRVVRNCTYDLLGAADAAMISSGTATVEAALLGTPMVVVYRVSRATAQMARWLVRTPFFSMVNLIAGRRVVPELIQNDFTAEKLVNETGRLLTSARARAEMKSDLHEVRDKLGPGGAIERAADLVAAML